MEDITTHHTDMNNEYLDMHCHALFGLDDGAQTIEESLKMLKNFEKLGFTKVILTPHYKNAYHPDNATKKKAFNALVMAEKENDIHVKLYLSNEVRITGNIIDLIKKGDEISMVGNNLFLELPFTNSIVNLSNVIFELQSMGINVIIVHPERYLYLKNEDYKKLYDKDVMFQVNYESIIGTYGRESKKRCKYLLKNDMVAMIGSDSHKYDAAFFTKFDKIKKKLIKLIGEYKFHELTYENIERMIEEEEDKDK